MAHPYKISLGAFSKVFLIDQRYIIDKEQINM
jgi:hypothetical protein